MQSAIAWLEMVEPRIRWNGKDRAELHREFHRIIKDRRNLSSGKYAVAIVGSRQWMREAAIGDGITAATSALVTRCETQAEAEAIAEAANELEPGILPGQGFAWAYQACRYAKKDYIGSQNWNRNQRRDCDRRIA